MNTRVKPSNTRVFGLTLTVKHTFFVITFAATLWFLNATTARADVAPCGVGHAQTTSLRNSSHFAVVLMMNSRDDYGKNTHLCFAEYTLQVTRPDGSLTQPFTFGDSDGKWGRPLVFRIDDQGCVSVRALIAHVLIDFTHSR